MSGIVHTSPGTVSTQGFTEATLFQRSYDGGTGGFTRGGKAGFANNTGSNGRALFQRSILVNLNFYFVDEYGKVLTSHHELIKNTPLATLTFPQL